MNKYNASSIRILRDEEVLEFEWAKIGSLAAEYGKDAAWIRRGFEACQHSGVSEAYFVTRYIRGDKSIPFHPGVEAAFRDLFVRRTGRSIKPSQ